MKPVFKVVEESRITHLAAQLSSGIVCYVSCNEGVFGTHPSLVLFQELHSLVGREVCEYANDLSLYSIAPFLLLREKDPTGVSGTGVVGEGAAFSFGSRQLVFLQWKTVYAGVSWFESLEKLLEIHGHEGMTTIHPSSCN